MFYIFFERIKQGCSKCSVFANLFCHFWGFYISTVPLTHYSALKNHYLNGKLFGKKMKKKFHIRLIWEAWNPDLDTRPVTILYHQAFLAHHTVKQIFFRTLKESNTNFQILLFLWIESVCFLLFVILRALFFYMKKLWATWMKKKWFELFFSTLTFWREM